LINAVLSEGEIRIKEGLPFGGGVHGQGREPGEGAKGRGGSHARLNVAQQIVKATQAILRFQHPFLHCLSDLAVALLRGKLP
jgi:hypothetical protein